MYHTRCVSNDNGYALALPIVNDKIAQNNIDYGNCDFHAVSINYWDFGLLGGDLINRLLNGLLKPKRKILGSDIAGRIEAIGKNVTRFKVGDEVYGDLSSHWGGFAEYTCAGEKSLVLKPAAMSFEEVANK